jgi:Kef-type K+ transport system membrane component KefB
VTVVALFVLPRLVPWFFETIGPRVSEPEIKLIFFVLLGIGGLASIAKSEAVLPAYLIGMALAPSFARYHVIAYRMRAIAFAGMTPFYFLKSGSLVQVPTIITAAGLVGVFFSLKMLTKFVGVLPLTKAFRFDAREGMYTTLLMCTGLTFGTISALFGLTNHIIDETQYTVLVTAVILSAVVPTLIAERWFQPEYRPIAREQEQAAE